MENAHAHYIYFGACAYRLSTHVYGIRACAIYTKWQKRRGFCTLVLFIMCCITYSLKSHLFELIGLHCDQDMPCVCVCVVTVFVCVQEGKRKEMKMMKIIQQVSSKSGQQFRTVVSSVLIGHLLGGSLILSLTQFSQGSSQIEYAAKLTSKSWLG